MLAVGYHGILLLGIGKLHDGGSYLDTIVAGDTQCEMAQCDHSVGYSISMAIGAGRVE